MAAQPVKIVVWDSIGNTLLGVRPWSSWRGPTLEHLLRENADGPAAAPSFTELFAGRNVELTWFNSADQQYEAFGALTADFPGQVVFTKDVEQIGQAAQQADYLVLHKHALPGEYILNAPNLKLVQHLGQDARGVPMDAVWARGIPVAATPLVNYITVAEQVWAYILNWFKRLPAIREHMKGREYTPTWGMFPNTKHLGDVTLGLLGMGEIARPIAKVAQAFGMPVIYWDIQRFPELEERYGMTYVEWDEIFAQSDVLSTQLALNDKTQGIIGAREFGLMKPTSLFINTARGKLMDQQALTTALQNGGIAGVALDVYSEEPLPTDDPLLAMHDTADERITLTPHCGWQSPWTWVRDSQQLWFNVLASMDGTPLKHLV